MSRSIAEIIGLPGRDYMTVEEANNWLDGMGYGEPIGPVVDDLLAWLREQGYMIRMESAHDAEGASVELFRWEHTGGRYGYRYVDETSGPSLLAALEQAVRAVAGES